MALIWVMVPGDTAGSNTFVSKQVNTAIGDAGDGLGAGFREPLNGSHNLRKDHGFT